jgi:hypothetical protein
VLHAVLDDYEYSEFPALPCLIIVEDIRTVLPSKRLTFSQHQWLSEFVTQYWLSMFYSSRDIQILTAILLF